MTNLHDLLFSSCRWLFQNWNSLYVLTVGLLQFHVKCVKLDFLCLFPSKCANSFSALSSFYIVDLRSMNLYKLDLFSYNAYFMKYDTLNISLFTNCLLFHFLFLKIFEVDFSLNWSENCITVFGFILSHFVLELCSFLSFVIILILLVSILFDLILTKIVYLLLSICLLLIA